jgi:UDP-N-acetylglucosamine 2-epimerase (non-hydrolysing)
MPEEVNRIVTDALSDVLFTTEESANENLKREGVQAEKIYFVGNVMIDTLLRYRSKAKESTILKDLQLFDKDHARPYAILTLHRPANVDDRETLIKMLDAFFQISRDMPLVFPVHPRTLKQIQEADLGDYCRSFHRSAGTMGFPSQNSTAAALGLSRAYVTCTSRIDRLRRNPRGNHDSWCTVHHLA